MTGVLAKVRPPRTPPSFDKLRRGAFEESLNQKEIIKVL
jgi:hypothetical protein